MSEQEYYEELASIAQEDQAARHSAMPSSSPRVRQEERDEPLSVSINSPHKAEVRGRSIALTISDSGASNSSSTSSGAPITVILMKNGVRTYYSLTGIEIGPV